MSDVFTAFSEHYQRNIHDGAQARAIPARLINHHGREEPGVAITLKRYPRVVIPADDALRIAGEIADAIQWHKDRTNQEPTR